MEAYSSIVLISALYVESSVALCLPHFVEERTLSKGIFFNVSVVSLKSGMRPSIFGLVCIVYELCVFNSFCSIGFG